MPLGISCNLFSKLSTWLLPRCLFISRCCNIQEHPWLTSAYMWRNLISPLAGFSSTAHLRTSLFLLPQTQHHHSAPGEKVTEPTLPVSKLSFLKPPPFCWNRYQGKTFPIPAKRGGPPLPLYMATCTFFSEGITGKSSALGKIDPTGKIRTHMPGRFLGKLDQFCNAAPCTVAGSCCWHWESWREISLQGSIVLPMAAGLESEYRGSAVRRLVVMLSILHDLQSNTPTWCFKAMQEKKWKCKQSGSIQTVFLNILFYHRERVISMHGRAVILNGTVWNRKFL